MRITFVLPHAGLAGGARVVAIYADRLRRRGHDVFVVSTPRQAPALKQKVKSLLKGHGWPGVPEHGPSHLDGLGVPWKVLEQCRPVTDRDVPDADVVVATWWETTEWVRSLSGAKGVAVHFLQGDDRIAYVRIPTWIPAVEATWHQPLAKVAVSNWIRDQVLSVVPTAHIDVVPNGVCTSQFYSGPRSKPLCPTIGFVYSPTWCKGTDIAIAAIAEARCQFPELRVIAFGNENPGSGMPLPGGAQYVLAPAQDRLRELYSACAAWLFPSRAEGFGLPILEAMACRTPVIGTPAGAAPELISQGGGILVEHDKPKAMADAIAKVCRMADTEWRAMSDAAYATARRYSWDEATDLFERALERAVERSGRGELRGGAI